MHLILWQLHVAEVISGGIGVMTDDYAALPYFSSFNI
jgi:hypothetical protein